MKSIFKRVMSIGVFLSSTIVVSAQSTNDTMTCAENSCCCSSDPTPAGVMISHVHNKNEWMISYRYMNMQMNGMLQGTTATNKEDVFLKYLMAPDKMQMDMHMLMAMYGITNKLTVMSMFNYNVNTMSMSMFATNGHNHSGMGGMNNVDMSHNMKTSGISDVKLHFLYSLIKKERHQLLVALGASLPTGNIKFKGKSDDMMYPNQRYPYAMQLGSGTFDILPCVNYIYQKQKTTFSAQLSSVVRTSKNQIGYKLGNEETFNTWIAYQWFKFLSASIRVEGTHATKISGYDPAIYYYREPSANPYNYGGNKISSFIGTQCHFQKGVLKNGRIAVEYGIPVYQNLNGLQMKLQHTLNASLSIGL